MWDELAAMDEIHEHFAVEFDRAVDELTRLQELATHVGWYNFETVCRHWRSPWAVTLQSSPVVMHGARHVFKSRRGRRREVSEYPIYYEGTIGEAPPLPLQIVLSEITDARAAVEALKLSCAAPYDWAPGGRLYEQMLRESAGVAQYDAYRTSKLRKEAQ